MPLSCVVVRGEVNRVANNVATETPGPCALFTPTLSSFQDPCFCICVANPLPTSSLHEGTMFRSSNESPMDFQFDNKTGPIDARSPFAQISSNAVNMTPRKSEHLPTAFHAGSKLTAPDQGTQGGVDSPSKSRAMGNQQSSPSKPLPQIPAWSQSLFNTPRRLQNDFDDSSAGETPKSPEPRDDSEFTPEIKNTRSALTKLDSATAPTMPGAERERSSPSKQRPTARRESSLVTFAKNFKNKIYSPGRGEIHRPEHAGAIEKATRRRKREVDRRVKKRRHSMSDSGEDAEQPKLSRKGSSEEKPHWAGSLFSFIAQHPSLPQTLSYYAQFMFNIFLLCCCGYLIYCFWSAVKGDVDKRADEAMADAIAKIKVCAEDYRKNYCDKVPRPPYAENLCNTLDTCMNRDPRKVGRAKVSAHTFAEIFNSFIEPISYKAMLFTAIMVFGCFGISNFVRRSSHKHHSNKDSTDAPSQAFGIFRSKAQQWPPPPNYGYAYPYGPPPPPTPQRSFSNQEGGFYPGTPWHQAPPGMGFEPQPSGGFGQIEGQGSPQRRLVYN